MIDGVVTVFERWQNEIRVSNEGITLIVNGKEVWMNWEKFITSYGKKVEIVERLKRISHDLNENEHDLTI